MNAQGNKHPVQKLNKTTDPIPIADGVTPSKKIKMEKRRGEGNGELNF
jgi:hypothetical protein